MSVQTYGKYRHQMPDGDDVERVATDMLRHYVLLDQSRAATQHQGAIQYACVEELSAETEEDREFWRAVLARLHGMK